MLQLDHDNACAQCKSDVFGTDKFGLVVAAVAAQRCVGLTLALFVALCASNHRLCRTSAWVPSHSIACDLAFHTILLCGASEGY